MKLNWLPLYQVTLLLVISTILGCTNTEQKKVFYLNSYHEGYKASDEVMAGIKEIMKEENVSLSVFFMDAKRKSSDQEREKVVKNALEKMEAFNPNLIIVSDDDAVKFVITPYFKNRMIPVVFCGVNWSAKQYGLPVSNITGMIEVLPIEESIQTMMKYYPKAKKLVVISENSVSERKNTAILDKVYKKYGFNVSYQLVDNFEAWKIAFKKANNEADLIYLPTNGAIKGWKIKEAKDFVNKNILKPVFTCDDFMMAYAVYGLTKVAKEQGLWAGKTAVSILKGASPSTVPVSKNTQSKSFINPFLAKKIRFVPSPELISSSEMVNINY